MADEEPDSTATAVETPPETPETSPAETSPPDALTQERERAIRAEAQAEAYKDAILARPVAEAPKPPSSQPLTAAEQIAQHVDTARSTGRLSALLAEVDAARAEGKLESAIAREYERAIFRAEGQEAARQELHADRQRQKEQGIAARLGMHLDARPGLSVPGSPETRAVRAWIEERGGDPESRSTQLMACDALFGAPQREGVTVREHTRRKVLGGGGGGPVDAGGDSAKVDPLKGVPPDILAGWRRLGAQLDNPETAKFYAARWNAMQERRAARAARA